MSDNNKGFGVFAGKKLPQCIRMASGISLMAVGVATPSFAQEGEEAVSEYDAALEEIVVTGQRASILSAQAIKRDAEQVVDAISAVDIGALPDRSVSEALQRVPGVQLQRTNANRDPARLAAEGGGVFVRGLGWVRTELNGRDIFSAANGRTLGFEDVSADLLAGVDVYKNPTADQVEGGLGGTVNLRTRLPLEQNERLLAFSADYNYADLYGEGFASGSGLYSDRWDVGQGEVGFLFSASVAEIGNRTDAIQSGRYETHAGSDGSDVYLPTNLGVRRIDWEQDRNSYNGVFQWAPDDDLTFTAQAFYAEANPQDVDRGVEIFAPEGGNLTPDSGDYQYDADGVLQRGTLHGATMNYNTRYGKRESDVGDYSLGFEYSPVSGWALSGDLQYVKSRSKVEQMAAYTQLAADGNGNFPDVDFDLSGDNPHIAVSDQERLGQQDQYWWAAAMDHLENSEAESLAGRLDAEYLFDDNSFLKRFRFGARATDKDAITRQTGWNWSLLSNQYWLNNSPENTAFLHSSAADQSELYTFDDFMRGDVTVPTQGWLPTQSLVSSNTGAYEHFESMVANNGQFWGWAPLMLPQGYDENPNGDNVSAGINSQNEQTLALYTSVHFGDDDGEIFGVPFDGNLGLRVVETKTTASGRSVAGGISDSCKVAEGTGALTEECAGAMAFVDAYMAEMGGYKDFTNDYVNVLPSMNLRFMLQDDVQLRFGLSRGMVRPGFAQTRPYTNITFDFHDSVFNPNLIGTQGRATAGAPDLKATTADQFDTSVEWYFTESGSLTFAAFYKDIQDYVALRTNVESYTYGDQTFEFDVTRQTNAASGQLAGFELAYQQFYDMLPSPFDGLGMQANFTFVDNQGGINTALNPFDEAQGEGANDDSLPIEGMSRKSYNLALMYEKYDVSARLAYNWRERYLLTTSAAVLNRPVWFNDYGQLDASLFYNATDNLKFGLQATNLLNTRTELEVNGEHPQAAQYSWTDTDRRIAFVTRYSF
ncbi:TonB-dependent receptor [Microbulbifer celer]|uniref:TonB-dependent receptor n=1 Tax=Microbulbifer celer TaxID=435905 RepID=A0ABW3UD95_9GAMM|nr:TonB-dependent receptor [Microbulbifer celer]UFN59016.1 TonB-dependent receptor [Microbulbifer celer]